MLRRLDADVTDMESECIDAVRVICAGDHIASVLVLGAGLDVDSKMNKCSKSICTP